LAAASLIVSVVAVAIAGASAIVTYRHGNRLADLEAARRSDELAADLYVYVAHRSGFLALAGDEAVSSEFAELRVHNRGSADADRVDVFFTATGYSPSEESLPRIERDDDVAVTSWSIGGGRPSVVPLRCSIQWFDRRGPQSLTTTVHEFTEA
jgi:hypothetical protein